MSWSLIVQVRGVRPFLSEKTGSCGADKKEPDEETNTGSCGRAAEKEC